MQQLSPVETYIWANCIKSLNYDKYEDFPAAVVEL